MAIFVRRQSANRVKSALDVRRVITRNGVNSCYDRNGRERIFPVVVTSVAVVRNAVLLSVGCVVEAPFLVIPHRVRLPARGTRIGIARREEATAWLDVDPGN